MDAAFFRDRVTVEGAELLDTALSRGRGVVLASAFAAGADLALWKLASLGYSVSLCSARLRSSFLDQRLAWLRRARGVETLSKLNGDGDAGRTLREGRILAVTMDRPPAADGAAPAVFLGRATPGLSAPANLSREFGAPVLCVFSRRVAPGRWRVRLQDAAPTGDASASPDGQDEAARDCLRALERVALDAPAEHWWPA
jgi:KDO2-lipid IV(A) lauroyltransferase